ncbi:hypothetical protein GGI15_003538 [Coemansia interrupta]|uniref:E3 ubiquitin-protein ligase listerin n=1 Tax=Coemansia interrupta TaxID=1126814 RepID=A0A9W8LID4_9FUNG|nr:hypothetical protein GGI15_003538 [Coemansia interrupta]
MSGKKNQPRVKGNLKPTSSSRAADLLGGDMAAINAFKANPALAFSQFSRTTPGASSGNGPSASSGASSPASKSGTATPTAGQASSAAVAALDQIDGQLASQLKRLGKNDSKTKMRALFELKSYVGEHTWETGLEGMLLAWPPLFRKHIFDPDRRVRAAVANVNSALVIKIGKRLAAHLKQIAGPWVASYFDPHKEVARTSRSAFERVFPESKRPEVYAYCVGELIEFASDNILNQTQETLSDPRFVDPEDMRSKYEHVIGVSFGTLGLVVEEIDSEKLLEHKSQFDQLFGNKSALKFVSSQSSLIRRGFYRLIRNVMLHCPALARDTNGVLAHALLSSCFGDSDPNAHGDMWDAVLLTTKNYPQVWLCDSSSDSKKKQKKPVDRLLEFLRTRCRLAPTISYPSILALLANLPADVLDAPSFQSDFDNALWQSASVSAGTAEHVATGSSSSRANHLENVALVSAICECFSFLWTRSLKNASASDDASNSNIRDFVAKEISRETDRLWHFYLSNPESAEEMAQPVVKLYCKIENLSAKFEASLLETIWSQTSWFTQRRLSSDSVYPVVYLVTRLASLDPATHGRLITNARSLLVTFCQQAIQSPDSNTAQNLIQTLSQLAPEIVFQEGFSTKFSMRLEGAGSSDEAIDLVLSKAQYLIESTGSAVDAAQSVDSFIASKMERIGSEFEAADAAYRLVKALLVALPGSEAAKSPQWNDVARLPSLGRSLLANMPTLPTDSRKITESAIEPPSLDFVRLLGQALLIHFTSDAELFGQSTADSIFEWMECVFTAVYQIQWEQGGISASDCLSSWTSATYEVLNSWTVLSRDLMAGPRFVRFWLNRSGSQAHSALGLIFDFAISKHEGKSHIDEAVATMVSKIQPQSKRLWSAVEAQLMKLNLGSELSRALADSISSQLCNIAVSKNPSHLARLAHSVYTRICPQSDTNALKSLVYDWVLDERQWTRALNADSAAALGLEGQSARYLALASTSESFGLRQAVDGFAISGVIKPFHTLAHWSANAGSLEAASFGRSGSLTNVYDVFGLSRFARRAIFAIDFVQISGGLSVLHLASNATVAAFISNMTLAYVLLREALLLVTNAQDSDEAESDHGGNSSGSGPVSIIRIDGSDGAELCERIDTAARAIQDFVSDLLSVAVVHGSSLPQHSGFAENDEGVTSVKAPRDPSRWLSQLMEAVTSKTKGSDPETTWEILVDRCTSKSLDDIRSPWAMVLGNLVDWCQWAFPLDSADIEATVANPLSRRVTASPEPISWTGLVTTVVRAVSLRRQCAQSPALQSMLHDVVSQLSKTSDPYQMVAQLELLAEMLPSRKASLDASASTPKIVAILTSLPEKLADSGVGLNDRTAIPIVLAALAVVQRFAICAPTLDGESAIKLVRLCIRWTTLEVAATNTGDSVVQEALLVAVSRAVSSLARMCTNMIEDSMSVVGPAMRQIGDQLVDRCVLSERPVAEGIYAITQLVKCQYYDVPSFTRLYPVLASASPRLVVELVRLVLASTDIAGYVGANTADIVRLVSVAAKALSDLSVPLDEFSEAVESDEYIRGSGLRLLSSLVLIARCADGMVADAEKHEEMTDLLNQRQVLDGAMPWVCALLGLGNGSSTGVFNARLWDVAANLDWETWAGELILNPTSDQLFRVLAHHVLYSVAWAFPSSFRLWWAGLSQGSRATSVAVEQFVTKHISPSIVEHEMGRIRRQGGDDEADQDSDCDHDDGCDGDDTSCSCRMQSQMHRPTAISQVLEEYDESTVRAGATQATLTYTIDDSVLEIAVRMPPGYPLALPSFECAKRVAVTEKRWRGWLVSAQAQMARNRRMDSVCAQLLGNIGAHFAGVEDCAICYSAVGTMDNSLPSKQCGTCKKKFHRMCIFKWFNTSNQSTCPMCRNLF